MKSARRRREYVIGWKSLYDRKFHFYVDRPYNFKEAQYTLENHFKPVNKKAKIYRLVEVPARGRRG